MWGTSGDPNKSIRELQGGLRCVLVAVLGLGGTARPQMGVWGRGTAEGDPSRAPFP